MQVNFQQFALGLLLAMALAGAAAAQGAPPGGATTGGATPGGAPPSGAPDPSSRALVQTLKQHDAGGMQTVALFENACLTHIGDAAGLRALAAAQGLPAAPADFAAQMLRGQPGQVFNASTPTAKRALVSFDNGMCAVNSFALDTQDIELLILADLQRSGAEMQTTQSGKSADGVALIHMYQLALQGQHPIVTFVDLIPRGGSIAAAHELDISGGNLALKF